MPWLCFETGDLDKHLRWGALSAFGLGGTLLGLAHLQKAQARELDGVIDITSLLDFRSLNGKTVSARGEVSSPGAFGDTLSKRQAVASVVEEDEVVRKRYGNEWKEVRKQVRSISRRAPLYLTLAHGNKLHVEASDKDVKDVVEHAATRIRQNDRGLLVQAVHGLAGYVVTGYIDTEYILPADTKLTAVGKLTLREPDAAGRRLPSGLANDLARERGSGNRAPEPGEARLGGSYALEPVEGRLPLYRCTLSEHIRRLNRVSRELRWAAIGCGAIGVLFSGICLYRIGRRALQRRRQRKLEQRFLRDVQRTRQQNTANGGAAPGPGAATPRSDGQPWQCTICWETDAPQTVFPGCGHVVACERCASRLHHCPVCRTASRPRRIFFG